MDRPSVRPHPNRRNKERGAYNPSPTMETADTLHLLNPKCQQATERAGDSGSGKEDSDAHRLLATLVPEGDIVRHTGEETGFCQAEEDACAAGGG